MLHSRNPFLALLAVLTAGTSLASTGRALFHQLNVRFDGAYIAASGWGQMEFNVPATGLPYYCNLCVNGQWQVRNILVWGKDPSPQDLLPSPASLASERQTLCFPLGTADGQPVSGIAYGLTFTASPRSSAPPINDTALVSPALYQMDHGFQGVSVPYFPARPLGEVFFSKGTTHGHDGIHNHPCKPMECVPNAVSLCMEYLWTEFDLASHKVAWANFTVKALKPALDWDGGCTDSWIQYKDSYLQKVFEGKDVTVSTTRLNGNQASQAYDHLGEKECVVELSTGTHCVAVRRMTPNLDANGQTTSYEVEVMDCAPQDGKDSSCSTETLTVKPDGTITNGSGAPWWGGKVVSWCVQCFKKV